MKKLLLCTVMALTAVFLLSAAADAVMIRNMSGQALLIPIPGKGTLQLAPNATAEVTQDELKTPALQNQIRQGRVKVVTPGDRSSAMVMIKNVSGQALLIPIPGKGTLQLAPGATASVTQDELQTPALQNQVRQGRVKVVRPAPPRGVKIR